MIWEGIRHLITLKHKNKRQPSIITVKGKDVTNLKNIANAFNNFRSNHSTEHALISLIETIKKYLDNDEIVCRVFIDLQKAFDTISHEVLLEKLKHYGIRSKENNWFCSFLTNRKQYVSISGFFSQTKIVRCGVPQGSTLGPLLFLIYINDLNNALDKCRVHHFADD